MKILLVEPNYKNKYPPIGLMKISTYHKNKGDRVRFVKGLEPCIQVYDKVYITTLFTFHYKIVLKTIEHYKQFVRSEDDIIIGGVMASLMKVQLKEDSQLNMIIQGPVIDSSIMGYEDHVNVDIMPLDYDLLLQTDYQYPAGDNFFGYTTRGCVNRCKFCAVPILEPEFNMTNNIKKQVNNIRSNYGDKRNLLLMDNNFLGLSNEQIANIVDDLVDLGFTHEPSFIKPSRFKILYDTVIRLEKIDSPSIRAISELRNYMLEVQGKRMRKAYVTRYAEILDYLFNEADDFFDGVTEYYKELLTIITSVEFKRKLKRYVDFNQGIDARLLSEEKMKLIKPLPIRPFRLAFDDWKFKDIYDKAIHLAYKHGVKEFSNYLLYNYEDTPEELWMRLDMNISLATEFDTHIFSFPMKFAPINETDRTFIGKHWNKHYLSNIHAILNVTKGIVARNRGFFDEAFGKNLNEYFEILSMPRDFVTYRNYFKKIKLTQQWKKEFDELSEIEKRELLKTISLHEKTHDNKRINSILRFYSIKYDNLKKNEKPLI